MRIRGLIGISIVAIAVATAVTPAGAAAKPAVRYASPSGTASVTCSILAPCDIETAINQAPAGSEVVIKPGTYDKTAPLTTTLQDTAAGLYIHGEAGKPLPTIYTDTSGNDPAVQINHSRLSHIAIMSTGYFGLVVNGGSADHIDSTNTYADGTACQIMTTLTDSVCDNTADGGTAIFEDYAATVHLTGVTAVAENQGVALSVWADTSPLNVIVTNSILHGGSEDIATQDFANDQTETVTPTYTDYATSANEASSGSTNTVVTSTTNVTKPPVFTDPATGSFTELASSPTVNKGKSVAARGDLDLAGNPRTVGSAPDMGAYELLQAPTLGKLHVTKPKPPTVVHLSLAVNTEGLPSTLQAVAKHGRTTIRSREVAVSADKRVTARLVLKHLKKHTRYSIYVFSSNAAGLEPTATTHVTTRKK